MEPEKKTRGKKIEKEQVSAWTWKNVKSCIIG